LSANLTPAFTVAGRHRRNPLISCYPAADGTKRASELNIDAGRRAAAQDRRPPMTLIRVAIRAAAAAALMTASAANASMIGTWSGRWYYSDEVVWKVPPSQSSFQMDLVITGDTHHADGTDTLVGHADFYFPDNVLSEGPVAWDTGTKNGFSVAFSNIAHYDYTATLNFKGDEMLGIWFPSYASPPGGVTPGCTAENVKDAYCGGFELHFQPAQVPEPASVGLLGLGLAGFLVRRRR
jgi:PEP-CTERM motif